MSEDGLRLPGRQVILRDKRLSDAADDYRWRTDRELARLDATSPLRISFKQYSHLFEDELKQDTPWAKRFAIETPEGRQIGNCMYYDADFVKKQAELGILIGEPEYWGNGFGTDAVDTMLRYVFAYTPFERMYLHTLEWNERALRSFEKSGFVQVKSVRRSGYDFILMELSRERWQELEATRSATGTDGGPEKPAA